MSRYCSALMLVALCSCSSGKDLPEPGAIAGTPTAGTGAGTPADGVPNMISPPGTARPAQDPATAIRLLDEAIQRSPEQADLYLDRGRIRFEEVRQETEERHSALGSRPCLQDLQATLDFELHVAALPDEHVQQRIRLMGPAGERLALAFGDFKTAERLAPRLGRVHRELGDVLCLIGDCRRALARYDRAIELNPDDAEARLSRGAGYLGINQFDRAVIDYEAALGLNPKLTAAVRGRANAWLRQMKFEPALYDINRVIEQDPSDGKALVIRALLRTAQNEQRGSTDMRGVITDLTQAISLSPGSSILRFLRASTYFKLGEHPQAIADCDAGIKIDPNDPLLLGVRAACKLATEHSDAALADINAAIALRPGYAPSYGLRQKILLERQELDQARADAQHAAWLNRLDWLILGILKEPQACSAWAEIADYLADAGDFVAAIELYDRGLRFEPDSSRALAGRAAVRLKTGNVEQAIADATASIASDPNSRTYSIRGDAHLQQASFDAAIEDYLKARRFDSKVARAYLLRSQARQAAGELEQAEADLRQARSIDPDIK